MTAKTKSRVSCLFLLCVTTVSACRTIPVELVTPLPLTNGKGVRPETVGLVVSDQLKNLVVVKSKGLGSYSIPIGSAVLAHTRSLLSHVFHSVVMVQPSQEFAYDLTIEPKLHEFEVTFPGLTLGTYRATVRLAFVVSAKGKAAGPEITVIGAGDEKGFGRSDNSVDTLIAMATNAALLDAMNKLRAQLLD